jgi:hypothetical protein
MESKYNFEMITYMYELVFSNIIIVEISFDEEIGYWEELLDSTEYFREDYAYIDRMLRLLSDYKKRAETLSIDETWRNECDSLDCIFKMKSENAIVEQIMLENMIRKLKDKFFGYIDTVDSLYRLCVVLDSSDELNELQKTIQDIHHALYATEGDLQKLLADLWSLKDIINELEEIYNEIISKEVKADPIIINYEADLNDLLSEVYAEYNGLVAQCEQQNIPVPELDGDGLASMLKAMNQMKSSLGIPDIILSPTVKQVVTLDGRSASLSTRGLVIVRTSDGRTKKVVVK